jgi:DNA gyrase/topoisomerase IV subunit B
MFEYFWPELINGELGQVIYKLNTPVVRVQQGKNQFEFFTKDEYHEWEEKNKGKQYQATYLKGLGSNRTENFRKFVENPDTYIVPLVYNDKSDVEGLLIAFEKGSESSDKRKQWLYGDNK